MLIDHTMFNKIHNFYEKKDEKEMNPTAKDQTLDHCQITKPGSNFHVQSIPLKFNDKDKSLLDFKTAEEERMNKNKGEDDVEKEVTDDQFIGHLKTLSPGESDEKLNEDLVSFKQKLYFQSNGYDIRMDPAHFKIFEDMTDEYGLFVVNDQTVSVAVSYTHLTLPTKRIV